MSRISPGMEGKRRNPYGIKTVSTRFEPLWPALTRIVTRINSWWIPGATIRRWKIFGHVKKFRTDFNSVLISVLTRFEPAAWNRIDPWLSSGFTVQKPGLKDRPCSCCWWMNVNLYDFLLHTFQMTIWPLSTRIDPYGPALIPYQPGLTRFNCIKILNWILFDPVWAVPTRFDPYQPWCKPCCMRYTARVNTV